MGGVSKISDQFSFITSIIALGGAVFLIIKAMLSNLVETVPGDWHSDIFILLFGILPDI